MNFIKSAEKRDFPHLCRDFLLLRRPFFLHNDDRYQYCTGNSDSEYGDDPPREFSAVGFAVRTGCISVFRLTGLTGWLRVRFGHFSYDSPDRYVIRFRKLVRVNLNNVLVIAGGQTFIQNDLPVIAGIFAGSHFGQFKIST